MRHIRPDSRRGLSLVELLVIVAILTLLMALVLVSSMRVWNRVTEARTRSEISRLQDACEAFKHRYGRYPPSMIVLQEKGGYPQPGIYHGPGGSGSVTVTERDADSARELRELFPGIDLDLYTNSAGREWHDWNGNGAPDDESYTLFGYQCLVFFLGGIPKREESQGSIAFTGFNADKAYPTRGSPGTTRDGPFFQFDPKRISVGSFPTPTHVRARSLASFPMYVDPYGTPYAYSRPGNVLGLEVGEVAIGYNQSHNEFIPRVKPDDIEQTATAYHHPRTNPRVRIEWYNSSRFQIVSAGRDKRFGGGYGPWPPPPEDQNENNRQFLEHLDNLTNFCDGRLQTLLK